MTRYEEVAFELERHRGVLEAELAKLIATLEDALPGTPGVTTPALRGRVKSAPSVWLKMHRYGVPYDQVHDLLGVRVVVQRVGACYRVADAVQALWPGRCVRSHDYIAAPKDNGYRALHVCIRDPAWPPFEVQIRTVAMDRACGRGTRSHDTYKASLWGSFLDAWTQAISGSDVPLGS